MDMLKLVALDTDDLAVVSTHVQDSIVKVGDILWRPAEKRVVVVVNRFDWENAQSGAQYRRRLAALRFERVNAFKARNVAQSDKDRVLNLLAVEFAAGDAPAGRVTFIFSGGAANKDEAVFDEVRAIRDGGGFGSIIGRNSFQRKKPEALKFLSTVMGIYAGTQK